MQCVSDLGLVVGHGVVHPAEVHEEAEVIQEVLGEGNLVGVAVEPGQRWSPQPMTVLHQEISHPHKGFLVLGADRGGGAGAGGARVGWRMEGWSLWRRSMSSRRLTVPPVVEGSSSLLTGRGRRAPPTRGRRDRLPRPRRFGSEWDLRFRE